MKISRCLYILSLGLLISACGGLPSECQEAWTSIEKLAKDSGIPEESLKARKKEFEAQIKALPRDQAIETCKAQNSVLGFIP